MNTGNSTAPQPEELQMSSHWQVTSQLMCDLHYSPQCIEASHITMCQGTFLATQVHSWWEMSQSSRSHRANTSHQRVAVSLQQVSIWPTVSKTSEETSKHNSRNYLCTRCSWEVQNPPNTISRFFQRYRRCFQQLLLTSSLHC